MNEQWLREASDELKRLKGELAECDELIHAVSQVLELSRLKRLQLNKSIAALSDVVELWGRQPDGTGDAS